MFSSKIVDSDAFLDMPASAQNLYFHLSMRADDDGFVGNPKKISKICGANDDDLKVLVAKRFVLSFENGVVVIKHWLIHNLIRADLYHETQYKKEKSILGLNENGAYTELREGVAVIKQIEEPDWLKRRKEERRDVDGTLTGRKVREGKVSKELTSQSDVSPTKPEEPQIGHQEIMEYFSNSVKKDCSQVPKINGKDGKMLKTALKQYSVTDIKGIIDFYLNSDKVEKFGYNLSTALSKDTINQWLYSEKRLR